MTDTAQAPRNLIFNGDYTDVMQAFDTGSVDMILTDHPMSPTTATGRAAAWPMTTTAAGFAEMHRVLKDGGFAVSFYGWNKVHLFMEAWRTAGLRPDRRGSRRRSSAHSENSI